MKSYEEFCEPSYLCESDDPEIKELARKIVGKKEGKEAVKAIFEWVRDEVRWGVLPVIGAKKLLRRKPMQGICLDKVNLFIALCRALRIPARYLMVKRDLEIGGNSLRIQHAVAEVLIGKEWWVLDPTFGKHTRALVKPMEFENLFEFYDHKVLRLKTLPRLVVWLTNLLSFLSPTHRKLKKILLK
jgi:transglutaminase-like putative cysteine protease